MNILGLYGNIDTHYKRQNYFHNANISLIKNSSYAGSFEIEKFSRIKNDGILYKEFILYILAQNKLNANDINIVVNVENFIFAGIKELHGNDFLENYYKELFPNATYYSMDHHLSHAMTSFMTSNYEESNFLSLDGLGGLKQNFIKGKYIGNYGGFGIAHKDPFNFYFLNQFYNHDIQNEKTFLTEFTIGNFYSSFSQCIYKKIYSDYDPLKNQSLTETLPGKIMGLSGYGDKKKIDYFNELPEIISIEKNLYYDLPEFIYNFKFIDFYESFLKNLNAQDLAFWLQYTFQNIILKYLEKIPKIYKKENLCLSGGCSLNVLLNSQILENNIYKNVHVHPATTDSGLSLGAALLVAKDKNLNIRLPFNLGSVGLSYNKKYFETHAVIIENKQYEFFELLKKYNLTFEEKNLDDIILTVSSALLENKIVAWFQGKSEYGPRALGNRSILANPTYPNKDYLNEKVKFREKWRPYAAIIIKDLQNDWINIKKQDSFYMLFSGTIKEEKRHLLPAVTHIDNTVRVQCVNEESDPLLNKLLHSFFKLSGVPILLNTSFNTIKGEPIVESPFDAIKSFLNSKIDLLIINNFIITRNNNETHNGNPLSIQTN